MSHQLIRKFEHFGPLPNNEKDALTSLLRRPLQNVGKGVDIIGEGEKADGVRILLSGWAFRYKKLTDGRRQILSIVLPADICDINLFASFEIDHTICAATPLVIAEIPYDEINQVIEAFPALRLALWWDMQMSRGLLHESIVNIGQRTALERMANLFCEICIRLQMIGAASDDLSFNFPLTQADLAAATGLSTVHVNRTLQDMRQMRLIALSGRSLQILDLPMLKHVALFNPAFLHLPKPSSTQRIAPADARQRSAWELSV